MEKKARYSIEYYLILNDNSNKKMISFFVPYPAQRGTYTCSIGASECCNYYFNVVY